MGGILHVCTANRIRSPIAEVMMKRILGDTYPIGSAGIAAVPGQPIWPQAGAIMHGQGYELVGFVSRRITPALVADADLILTATRAHRDQIIAGTPRTLGRVFTWRELAWLIEGLEPADVAARSVGAGATTLVSSLGGLVVLAGARRGHLPVPKPVDLDVIDPVDRPSRVLLRVTRQIRAAIETISRLL
jgi:protein-tyrosine phosphatase